MGSSKSWQWVVALLVGLVIALAFDARINANTVSPSGVPFVATGSDITINNLGQATVLSAGGGSGAFQAGFLEAGVPPLNLALGDASFAESPTCGKVYLGSLGWFYDWGCTTANVLTIPASVTVNGTLNATGTANPNLIQNGGMLYDRRHAGASVTITTGGANIFSADRWLAAFTTSTSSAGNPASVDGTVSAANGTFVNSILQTNSGTPATTSPAGLTETYTQAIEGSDVSDLGFGTANAGTVTATVWAKASVALTYSISLRNSATNRAYVHNCPVTTANVWARCTATIPGDTTGTWLKTAGNTGIFFGIALAGGSTFQATADTWSAGNFTATSATSNYLLNTSGTFEFTGVKLERGTVATAYAEDPVPVALQKLGHFYQTSALLGTAPADAMAIGNASCVQNPIASSAPSLTILFQPPMFATPTVTTYNPSAGTANNWRNVTGSLDVARTVINASTTGVDIEQNTATTTINSQICIGWSADALQ